ncbi:diguanylate cyclase/phosphodiesterase with PAS/PAC sensor(s) [Amphritea atlantica]|uniref:cyclic-guanylate-specific phosphodiesterase n=1 Tax=Amphritea atlantica TaxID=355243 RepID=A0A1H9GLR6_9GAMM|nr:EAL domain-containing protein [Amphritea atlantica]SEQ51037.1 diguanylate cyclase/phosphodiesterase with PAS/PAC sensor(s) [Amphritea atlantica]
MSRPPKVTSPLLVRHIAQSNLITCTPDSTADSLIRLMADKKIGCIVVCENRLPVGIVTRRDLIGLWAGNAQHTPVTQFMSSPVHTVSEWESVDEAGLKFIAEEVRHFVVTKNSGEACGIITETDVVNSHGIEHDLFLRSVEEIADHSPVSVDGNSTVLTALQKLNQSGRSALLITLHNEISGIFTERDAVALIAQDMQGRLICDLCNSTLVTVEQSLSLYNARKVFLQHQFQHLAITNHQGKITGLISYSDILRSVENDYVYRLRELLNERDKALEKSQHSLKLADKVIEASMEAIVICDKNAQILRVNPSFTEITGYTSAEVLGKNPNILSSGRHNKSFYKAMWQSLTEQGFWQGEIWNRRKDGAVYPEWLSITSIRDDHGNISQYASIFTDLTEIKKSEARIRRLAYFDELTRLPNRKLFNDRLQLSIGYAREHQHRIAVAYIDVDFFQQINDLHGHETGDRVLKEIGRRIEHQLDDSDTVARFGGDEFNLILTDVDDTPHISEFLNRLLSTVNQPILIEDKELKVTVSIGVSFFPTDADDAESLLKCANSAVHLAKDFGRNSFRFFSPEQHRLIQSRYQMGSDLQAALDNGEFQLYFQPKVGLHTGRPTSCEALLRWLHPQLGFISPAEFIPLAEDLGLINRIGRFVLEEACQQIARWREQGEEINVAINLSARQFQQGDIAEQILECLKQHNLPAHLLSVELTESCFLYCPEETKEALNTLRSQGIQVAIDDFGTGYSSLSYIRTIALDILKIDRSFLVNLEASEVDRAIVTSIIEMSHVLGLQVVAEGIEHQSQVTILKQMKCDQLQGFLLARPMPADAFINWYKHQNA